MIDRETAANEIEKDEVVVAESDAQEVVDAESETVKPEPVDDPCDAR